MTLRNWRGRCEDHKEEGKSKGVLHPDILKCSNGRAQLWRKIRSGRHEGNKEAWQEFVGRRRGDDVLMSEC
jgi:hypothetical protein